MPDFFSITRKSGFQMNSKYYSILYFSSLHEKYHIYPNARQSNLQQVPPGKQVCQGKMYLSKSKIPPPKKSANKKYFTINFIRLLYQSVSLSPSSQSVPLSPSHSLLTFPSSSLPFHNILSSDPSTVLDIQHFLQPFTVTSGEMYCHAILIHND